MTTDELRRQTSEAAGDLCALLDSGMDHMLAAYTVMLALATSIEEKTRLEMDSRYMQRPAETPKAG